MRPLLYVSFGMAKSGSTLAFNLVREMLIAAGIGQPRLEAAGANPENYVAALTPEVLGAALAAAEANGGPVALKTHRRPHAAVAAAIRQRRVIGHAVCRDPRDIVLSLVDATRKGLGWGRHGGAGFATPEEALPPVRNHVRRFEEWTALPGILPVHYEMLAFDTAAIAARIAVQLGLDIDLAEAVRAAKRHANQFNVGRPQRWRGELDPALADAIGAEFEDFIARWCGEFPEPAPRRSLLDRLLR